MTVIINIFSRGTTSLSIMLLPLIVGNVLGLEKLGEFIIFLAAITSASVLCRLGMDTTTLKAAGKDWESITKNKKQIFFCGIFSTLIGSIFINTIIFSYAKIFLSVRFDEFIIPLLIAIFTYSSNNIIGANLKASNKSYISSIFDSGGAELSTLLMILYFSFYKKTEINIIDIIYWITASSSFLYILGVSYFLIHYAKIRIKLRDVFLRTKAMLYESKDFLIISITTHLTGRGVPIIMALFFLPKVIGLYTLVYTISAMVSFISVIYNSIIPPKFSFFFQREKIKEINFLYKKSVIEMFAASSIITIFIYYFKENIFSFSNIKITDEIVIYLSIMIFSQLINVLTGPAGFLLNMTGHEKHVRNITLLLSIIFIFLISISGYLQYPILLFISFAFFSILRNILLFKKTYTEFFNQNNY